MVQRSVPYLVVSALLVTAPASAPADQLSVTVRATADEPAPEDTQPATLIEPGDVAETPEPICSVCAIVTKEKSGAATIDIPSADAFIGEVDVIVALADGRQVTGRITGVAVDPDGRRSIPLTSGTDWRWEDARAVWTRRHRTSLVRRSTPAIVWGEASAAGARAVTIGDSGVALTATQDLRGDLTLVIVSDPDAEAGRPERAIARLDGIGLETGDDLAMAIASAWRFDWDDVRAAWLEVRTDTSTAAVQPASEYKYISIRRF